MDGVCPEVIGEQKDSGRVGTKATLTINGGSRPVGGPYKILWSKTPITEESDYIILDEGEIDRLSTEVTVSFTIPEASYGTNYVQYRRQYRPEDPYGFMFTVLPDIKITPASVSPGSKVTIKGTGFMADDDSTELSFDGETIDMLIDTNSVGSFTVQFTVPNTMAGKHDLDVIAENIFGVDASASFNVIPKISLDPKEPEIGSEVTVTGCGFAANSEISVEYDGVAASNSPITDELGNFTHVFNVPESAEPEHVVTATDGAGNTATFSLPLEGEPPAAPATVSPQEQRFGLLGSQVVAFTWTGVTDTSRASYTLEIASNLNFFPLTAGMRKTELTQPTCLVNLPPGNYYWRVKAVDGAGNESDWSLSPYQFKVGFFSIWHLLVGGLIVMVILIFVVRAFYRRISEYL